MLRSFWILAVILIPAAFLPAEDWPCWRGPRGDGSSLEKTIPVTWRRGETKENIRWETELTAEGHSSPIVVGKFIYCVGARPTDQARMLFCFDRNTGKPLWERVVLNAPLEKIHKLNSHASSTPASDGERVFVSFLNETKMHLTAFSLDGEVLWEKEPGGFSSVHGYCSSPVVFENFLIVNGDHDGDAYLVALDRKTGYVVWKTPRENKTRSYCTPIIRDIEGRTQMLLSGSKSVASFDPRTGERHWLVDGPTEQFVASLVYGHGLVYVTGGFPDKHIVAYRPTGEGNVTGKQEAWHHERSGVSYVPSPVLCGDYFLVASDNGFGTCFDAKTGEIVWQERMGRHYSASLTTANGLVYFLDDDGVTKVVRPGPKYDLVATNELNDECYASPALANGELVVRTKGKLICIGESSPSK
jgi:outer membrane protein assembly factor BamB